MGSWDGRLVHPILASHTPYKVSFTFWSQKDPLTAPWSLAFDDQSDVILLDEQVRESVYLRFRVAPRDLSRHDSPAMPCVRRPNLALNRKLERVAGSVN
jgi:hypothetical protein